MSSLIDSIRMAQVRAAEDVVVASLHDKGLLTSSTDINTQTGYASYTARSGGNAASAGYGAGYGNKTLKDLDTTPSVEIVNIVGCAPPVGTRSDSVSKSNSIFQNIHNLPYGNEYKPKHPKRIVSAAIYSKKLDILVCAPRHFDSTMHKALSVYNLSPKDKETFEQGFVNTWGEFLTRQEAWLVALMAHQIVRRVGSDMSHDGVGCLFSENLY